MLVTRTEGKPLFLEESVRAVLAARIDRLPPNEKHLLETAAVIGKDVPDRAAGGRCSIASPPQAARGRGGVTVRGSASLRRKRSRSASTKHTMLATISPRRRALATMST
jgi:hypothetical protein